MSARGPWGDQFAARRYTARWHRVHAWATRVVIGDVEERPSRNPRVALMRGMWVRDIDDDDEAAELAVDLAELAVELGPDGHEGGRRRVLIRIYTWVVDLRAGVVHDPQWITSGEGLTARAAAAAHNRYIRAYASAVAQGIESRRLGATAMEVAWWTAAPATRYV